MANVLNNSASIGSFFTQDSAVNVSYTSNMAPLADGGWGEVEEDPEMRADDDFLEFYNSHNHGGGIGPEAFTHVLGHVTPASGSSVNIDGAFNPMNNGVFQIINDIDDPHEVDVDDDYVSWECMRCKIILAPHVDSCERCAPPWNP
jgi:hypothetical protein